MTKKKTVEFKNGQMIYAQLDFPYSKFVSIHDTRSMLDEVKLHWEDFCIDTSRAARLSQHAQTLIIRIANSSEKGRTPLAEHYPLIDSAITSLVEEWGGKSFGRFIIYLQPNGEVFPHTDGRPYYKNKDRFHLVLGGAYSLTVDGETVTLNEGELWWFDNKKVHSVKNLLNEPRISLVFDVLHGSSWKKFIKRC